MKISNNGPVGHLGKTAMEMDGTWDWCLLEKEG